MRLSKAERDAIIAEMKALTPTQRDEKRQELHFAACVSWRSAGIPYEGSQFFKRAWEAFLEAFVGLQKRESSSCTWVEFVAEVRRGVGYCRAKVDSGEEKRYNRLGNAIHDPGILLDCAAAKRAEIRSRLAARKASRKLLAEHPANKKTLGEHIDEVMPIAKASFASIRAAARHTQDEPTRKPSERPKFVQPTEQEILEVRRRRDMSINSMISNISQQLNPNTQNDY